MRTKSAVHSLSLWGLYSFALAAFCGSVTVISKSVVLMVIAVAHHRCIYG